MSTPDDRKYLQSHEWHKLDGDIVTIGISQFAIDELSDITFLEIGATEGQIAAGESFGEIESVKASNELYSGVDGQVVEVNQPVVDDPSIINSDPYDKGWMIKIKTSDSSQMDQLLSSDDYQKSVGQ